MGQVEKVKLFKVSKIANFRPGPFARMNILRNSILAGAGTPLLVYEVVPDPLATTVNTRVCKAEVKQIGLNLPCVEANANHHIENVVFNVSDVTKTMNDYAVLNIGSVCPSGATSDSSGIKAINIFLS